MEDDSASRACGKCSPTFDISDGIKKMSVDDEVANHPDSASSSKTIMTKQNATNFHPLMHSSVSQDFPDLIPETQRTKMFRPECHSSPTEVQLDCELQKSLEEKINMALSNYSYDERIQGRVSFVEETLVYLLLNACIYYQRTLTLQEYKLIILFSNYLTVIYNLIIGSLPLNYIKTVTEVICSFISLITGSCLNIYIHCTLFLTNVLVKYRDTFIKGSLVIAFIQPWHNLY